MNTQPVCIRTATPADLDAVEALEDSVFARDELSRRSLRYYIAAPTAVFLILECGSGIVGDAIVAFRRRSSRARLYSIAIRTEAAGRGFGRRLLAACEDVVRERGRTTLSLEVRSDNAAAIALYEKTGYVRFGVYEHYYEDGTTALRFRKSIAPVGGGDAAPVQGQRSP